MIKSSHARHKPQATAGAAVRGGDSARLLRSKSGGTAVSHISPITEAQSKYSKTSKKEDKNPNTKKVKKQLELTDGDGDVNGNENVNGGFVLFAPRSMSKLEVPRRSRSASTSPSAWALSPGRSMRCSAPPPLPAASGEKATKKEGKSGGGGVGGVLKYFRQKKVSPLMEDEYNRYRVAYNRLLQWRFANARAEASMATVNRVAQKRVLNGWVRISVIRNLIMDKKILIQKLKHEMKMYQIMKSEMRLLSEWSRLEPKNIEAVGRVVRKLSAFSVCLPLVQNAEADTMSVYDAICSAMEVMDNIKAMILDMHWQVERTCFLLTELSVMLKQQKQFFQELEKRVTFVASLEVQEKSLRAHHIQLAKEVNGIETSKDLIQHLI